MDWKQANELKLAQLHPMFADRVRAFLAKMESVGILLLIVQGLRTWDEQEAIWKKGRTVKSDVCCTHNGRTRPVGSCPQHPLGATVTNAHGGWSWHNFGMAIDFCPDNLEIEGLQLDWNAEHPAWVKALEIAPEFELDEGALWRTIKDMPHLYPKELTPTPSDFVRGLYAEGKLPEVWEWATKRLTAPAAGAASGT